MAVTVVIGVYPGGHIIASGIVVTLSLVYKLGGGAHYSLHCDCHWKCISHAYSLF